MRQRRACEGRNGLYRLRLEVDGTRALEEPAQGSAARQRRPILVFHELRLRPGVHHIRVELTRDRTAGEDDDQTGRDRDHARQETELPASLELSIRVALEPRSVMLVTYDPDRRNLVARSGEEVPGH
jgi:hypothetical protein